jgi:uncharacterized membrane protein YhaH (DUF805 family)
MNWPHFALAILDPRGRVSRKGLLIVLSLLIGVEIVGASLIFIGGLASDSAPILALKTVFVWIALSAAAKRLHDLGLSAWWIGGAVAMQLAWAFVLATAMFVSFGIEQMQPDSDGYAAMLAGCGLPAFAALLWLQVSEGEPEVNRYGAPPKGLGFSGSDFWTPAPTSAA